MAYRIPVRCFQFDPSVSSSLKFLRKTPWARKRIEEWFIEENREIAEETDSLNHRKGRGLKR